MKIGDVIRHPTGCFGLLTGICAEDDLRFGEVLWADGINEIYALWEVETWRYHANR